MPRVRSRAQTQFQTGTHSFTVARPVVADRWPISVLSGPAVLARRSTPLVKSPGLAICRPGTRLMRSSIPARPATAVRWSILAHSAEIIVTPAVLTDLVRWLARRRRGLIHTHFSIVARRGTVD